MLILILGGKSSNSFILYMMLYDDITILPFIDTKVLPLSILIQRHYLYYHSWLRTNGVNTSGAAAKVMNSDRSDWGKRYALALLGRQKQVNILTDDEAQGQKIARQNMDCHLCGFWCVIVCPIIITIIILIMILAIIMI